MRYIHKNKEPKYIQEWKALRKKGEQEPIYNEFDKKAQLNADLRTEQHGVCCYCQRVIDHFLSEPGSPETAAHNEHLYPQNIEGDERSKQLQMEYSNIFACCVDSRGLKKQSKLQHCGESKGNAIIPDLICRTDCVNYFYYSLTGEIIPIEKSQPDWKNYVVLPIETLTKREQDAVKCIKTLNLNCASLVADRKVCIDALFQSYKAMSAEELIRIKEELLAKAQYPSYVELRLQLINHLIEKKKSE